MNATYAAIALAGFTIAGASASLPAIALDEGHGPRGDLHRDSEHREHHREHHKAKRAKMEKHERKEDHFNERERDEIAHYYARGHGEDENEDARGGPAARHLHIVIGQRIADEEWGHRVPLPHEVLARLPTPPPGVVLVRIHNHVVKVREETHEVLDDMGLPHPP